MRSGDLRDRINIYELVSTRTATGAAKTDWQFKCSCRSRVNYSSGNRQITNDEIFYSVDREFIVRSYVPVKETDEIRWDNKRWQILSIDKNKTYNDIIIKTTLINE